MPFPIVAALAAGATIAGPAISGAINASQSRKNIAAQGRQNQALASQKFKLDQLMLNKMNQYNAPLAQMQRFKEAGLNPNLIYGQGTPGNQSQMAQYQQNPVDMSQQVSPFSGIGDGIGALGQQYQNTQIQQEQIIQAKLNNKILARESGYSKWYNQQQEQIHHKGHLSQRVTASPRQMDKMIEQNTKMLDNASKTLSQEQQYYSIKQAKANIKKTGLENQYKQFENKMAQSGLKIGDMKQLQIFFSLMSSGILPSSLDTEALKKITGKILGR